jgi:hypothetical protein
VIVPAHRRPSGILRSALRRLPGRLSSGPSPNARDSRIPFDARHEVGLVRYRLQKIAPQLGSALVVLASALLLAGCPKGGY